MNKNINLMQRLDMDGTLLNSQKDITTSTIKTIEKSIKIK